MCVFIISIHVKSQMRRRNSSNIKVNWTLKNFDVNELAFVLQNKIHARICTHVM